MRTVGTRWSGRITAVAAIIALLAALLTGANVLAPATAHAAGQQIFDGPNEPVKSTAVGADGTIYVGGTFTRWAPQTGGGAGLNAADGSVIRTLPPVVGTVNAAVADGVGGWYIGGTFTSVAGVVRNNLAHILSTGAVDLTWNPNTTGGVRALAVSGGTIYVGGIFTAVCGAGSSCGVSTVTRNNAAAFNADGTLKTTWNPKFAGGTTAVRALAVSGSTVYVGGDFTAVCGAGSSCGESTVTRNNAAAFNADGTLNTTWNPNPGNQVLALLVSGNTVYLGGGFSNICAAPSSCQSQIVAPATNVSRSRVAAVSTDGLVDMSWNPKINSTVNAIAISGSTIYLGGGFTSVCGAGSSCGESSVTRSNLAAFSTDGSLITTWNPRISSTVNALVVTGDTIYVAGAFTSVCGTGSSCNEQSNVTRSRLAAFSSAGTLVMGWDPNASNEVYSLTLFGSTFYAGGAFTTVGGVTRNRAAAINPDGSLSQSWNPNVSAGVEAIVVKDSKVYLGGSFTSVGGQPRNRLAAVATDGTLDSSWAPNMNSTVHAMAMAGNTLYVGGLFTTVGGVGRNLAAAVSTTDGSLVTTWNPSVNGTNVKAIVLAGDTVHLGGSFTSVCGGTSSCGASQITRSSLAAFGTDGTLATTWNPLVSGASTTVNAMALSDSTIYVGGSFTGLCGASSSCGESQVQRSNAAAISTDGTTVSSWNPRITATSGTPTVSALAVSGSTVYVGGSAFNRVCGTGSSCGDTTEVRNRVAAMGTDGTLFSWNPNLDGSTPMVNALVASSGSVYLGGEFASSVASRSGSWPRNFGIFSGPGLPGSPTNVAAARADQGATVSWTAPSGVGSGITGYKLETAPGPGYNMWTVAVADTGSAGTSGTIAGLTNGVNYRARVTALAAEGAGSTSMPSQWFTPQAPANNPGVPTGLAGEGANAAISAWWSAPVNPGAGDGTYINRYRTFALVNGTTPVRICQSTGTQVAPPATSCTLTNLTNGQSYTLTSRSFNNHDLYSDLAGQTGPILLP